MPNPSLTEAIKEAYASAPTVRVTYDTLEIRQGQVQAPIFLVRAKAEIIATDENGVQQTFRPSGFQFSLPSENEEGFRSLNIAIDNINREVTDFVEIAKSQPVPVEVIYRPYLSDDLSTPHMDPPLVLYLKELQINPLQVTGRATFLDVVNQKFPSELYNRARFPFLQ